MASGITINISKDSIQEVFLGLNSIFNKTVIQQESTVIPKQIELPLCSSDKVSDIPMSFKQTTILSDCSDEACFKPTENKDSILYNMYNLLQIGADNPPEVADDSVFGTLSSLLRAFNKKDEVTPILNTTETSLLDQLLDGHIPEDLKNVYKIDENGNKKRDDAVSVKLLYTMPDPFTKIYPEEPKSKETLLAEAETQNAFNKRIRPETPVEEKPSYGETFYTTFMDEIKKSADENQLGGLKFDDLENVISPLFGYTPTNGQTASVDKIASSLQNLYTSMTKVDPTPEEVVPETTPSTDNKSIFGDIMNLILNSSQPTDVLKSDSDTSKLSTNFEIPLSSFPSSISDLILTFIPPMVPNKTEE